MLYLPLVNTGHVAYSHGVGDTNSHEIEAIYLALAAVAWRTWRPFTRIGRAKRVGRHVLQATVPLTEDIHVTASTNAMLCKKTFTVQLRSVSDIKCFLYKLSKIYP